MVAKFQIMIASVIKVYVLGLWILRRSIVFAALVQGWKMLSVMHGPPLSCCRQKASDTRSCIMGTG